LPNRYDGDSLLFTSPLKLYEYFGIGLKVVCSRLPSIESSINSNLVYWSKAGDKDSLAEQILIALNDSNFDGNKIKEYSKNFTWEKRAEKLVQYVQSEMVDK
jgi:glycosyltransferase involved in cell wall biosynthesis